MASVTSLAPKAVAARQAAPSNEQPATAGPGEVRVRPYEQHRHGKLVPVCGYVRHHTAPEHTEEDTPSEHEEEHRVAAVFTPDDSQRFLPMGGGGGAGIRGGGPTLPRGGGAPNIPRPAPTTLPSRPNVRVPLKPAGAAPQGRPDVKATPKPAGNAPQSRPDVKETPKPAPPPPQASTGVRKPGDIDLRDAERAGGHTIREHVARTKQELQERLDAHPKLDHASSYRDVSTAEAAVNQTIAANRHRIAQWLKGTKASLRVYCNVGHHVGRVLQQGKATPVPGRNVTAVLMRDATSPSGYRVHTSYFKP